MKSIAWNAMSVTVISTAFENVWHSFFLENGGKYEKNWKAFLKLYMGHHLSVICNQVCACIF